ncbi:MAG: hypothetical protein NT007_17775 [Candidatus Kapabacteria bacterium]|nr:hypothetical protein [Candidatus Kapabacteria bacterium]
MQKMNVSLNPENYKLLSDYSLYGFKNRSEAVNSAINLLNRNLNKSLLQSSAELYLEEYKKDQEIENLTESALNDFME